MLKDRISLIWLLKSREYESLTWWSCVNMYKNSRDFHIQVEKLWRSIRRFETCFFSHFRCGALISDRGVFTNEYLKVKTTGWLWSTSHNSSLAGSKNRRAHAVATVATMPLVHSAVITYLNTVYSTISRWQTFKMIHGSWNLSASERKREEFQRSVFW